MVFLLYNSQRDILIRYCPWYLLSSFEEKQKEIEDIVNIKRLFVVDLLYNIISEKLPYLCVFRQRIIPNFSK